MTIKEILSLNGGDRFQKEEVTEKRITDHIEDYRKYLAFFRWYPDLLLDFFIKASGETCNFSLFFYQRVFLRACMRHRYVFCTFPRAYSKSFLAVLILVLRCILYPNADLFVTTGGKEQATSIAKSKLDEWLKRVPALKNEIDWNHKDTKPNGRDMVSYMFKNGAKFSIVALTEKNRGKRKTGGLVEEVITVEQKKYNEIVVPMMNVARVLPDGSRHDEDLVNKSQIFVTSAGYKGTFAYDKMIGLLVQSLTSDESFVMGGTWRVPVAEGLLSKNFVKELEADPTYNPDSFGREYDSEWSGSYDGSYFNSDIIDKARVLKYAEKTKRRSKKNCSFYYIFSLDFGRLHDTTEICIFKVYPQENGTSIKSLVNIISLDFVNALYQAVILHQLYDLYEPETIVIDANGNGISLLDDLIIPITDPRTDIKYEPWSVINDRKYDNDFTAEAREIIYVVKPDRKLNSECYTCVKDQLKMGKIHFLISEKDVEVMMEKVPAWHKMKKHERKKYLVPYVYTTGLKEQMMNLYDASVDHLKEIDLQKVNTGIPKDRFCGFMYGIYYIYQHEKTIGGGSVDPHNFLVFSN